MPRSRGVNMNRGANRVARKTRDRVVVPGTAARANLTSLPVAVTALQVMALTIRNHAATTIASRLAGALLDPAAAVRTAAAVEGCTPVLLAEAGGPAGGRGGDASGRRAAKPSVTPGPPGAK